MPNCLRHGADYETPIPLSSFDFTVSLAGQMTDGLWPCGFMHRRRNRGAGGGGGGGQRSD